MEPYKRKLSCFYYRGAVEGIVFYLFRTPFDEDVRELPLLGLSSDIDHDDDDDGDVFNTFTDLTMCQAGF